MRFDGNHRARLVRGVDAAQSAAAVDALSLSGHAPVLVVNGGTAAISAELELLLAIAMSELVDFAIASGAILVTGGTDAGIFGILGRQLATAAKPILSIGVAPDHLVRWPGRSGSRSDLVELEPHHTHFVLTKGKSWSDETPVMLSVITALTKGAASVAVIAGGGAGTRKEVSGHLSAGRPVISLEAVGLLGGLNARAGVTTIQLSGQIGDLTRVLTQLFDQAAGHSA